MAPEIVEQLVAINRRFYHDFAPAFSLSRAFPWKGYPRLSMALPEPCRAFLDVGCGDGRLGRYLLDNERITRYVGVDYSADLLAIGRVHSHETAQFHHRNLIKPGFLNGLGLFDGIACMATLHHIPGMENRAAVLREIGEHLAENGRLIFTTFQFMDSKRQRRKVVDWAEVGIDAADLEPTDYLLSFGADSDADQRGVRHINLIDENAVADLISQTEMTQIDQWRSDGKEGNLNLYTVLGKI